MFIKRMSDSLESIMKEVKIELQELSNFDRVRVQAKEACFLPFIGNEKIWVTFQHEKIFKISL